MASRKVILDLDDKEKYFFEKNSYYEKQWEFLKDNDRTKIIASQLTYLEFHLWLQENIKTQLHDNHNPQLLFASIAEGFIRTDIVLYGAICEMALFDAINWNYQQNQQNPDKVVKKCFIKEEKKVEVLNENKLVCLDKKLEGRIALYRKVESDNTYADFKDLVDAGHKLRIYGCSFQEDLHKLRENRNTIHLSALINKKQESKNRYFNPDDRKCAVEVTETLRQHIQNWYE